MFSQADKQLVEIIGPTRHSRQSANPHVVIGAKMAGQLTSSNLNSFQDGKEGCSAVENYARRGACPPLPADR